MSRLASRRRPYHPNDRIFTTAKERVLWLTVIQHSACFFDDVLSRGRGMWMLLCGGHLLTRWPQHIYLYKLLSTRAQLMTSPAVPWYHTDCMVRYQWGAHGRQQDGAGMKAPSWNFNMMPCCSPVKWPKFLLSPSVLVISTPKFGLKRWKISKISFFFCPQVSVARCAIKSRTGAPFGDRARLVFVVRAGAPFGAPFHTCARVWRAFQYSGYFILNLQSFDRNNVLFCHFLCATGGKNPEISVFWFWTLHWGSKNEKKSSITCSFFHFLTI